MIYCFIYIFFSVALYPGFGCEVNEQCQTLGVNVEVTCIESKCTCPESTHVSGLKCYKNIGKYCILFILATQEGTTSYSI